MAISSASNIFIPHSFSERMKLLGKSASTSSQIEFGLKGNAGMLTVDIMGAKSLTI